MYIPGQPGDPNYYSSVRGNKASIVAFDELVDSNLTWLKCGCTHNEVCDRCPESKKIAMVKRVHPDKNLVHPAKTSRAIKHQQFMEIKNGMEARLKRRVSKGEVRDYIAFVAKQAREADMLKKAEQVCE